MGADGRRYANNHKNINLSSTLFFSDVLNGCYNAIIIIINNKINNLFIPSSPTSSFYKDPTSIRQNDDNFYNILIGFRIK